jgi:hypothetical protein
MLGGFLYNPRSLSLSVQARAISKVEACGFGMLCREKRVRHILLLFCPILKKQRAEILSEPWRQRLFVGKKERWSVLTTVSVELSS